MRKLAIFGAVGAASIVLTGALAIAGPEQATALPTQNAALATSVLPTPDARDIVDDLLDAPGRILDVDIPGTDINVCLAVSVKVEDLIGELKLDDEAARKVRDALKTDQDLLDLRAKCDDRRHHDHDGDHSSRHHRPHHSTTTTTTVTRVRPYGKGCGTQVTVCPNTDDGIETGGHEPMPGDIVIG